LAEGIEPQAAHLATAVAGKKQRAYQPGSVEVANGDGGLWPS
jgi:hypothetical protein